ncbi:MAG: hypothetical protein AB7O26_20055, partial [Planctomycetaceae bacterium]
PAIRWTARITGFLIVGVFLLFLIGEGFDPRKLTGAEIPQHAALLVALFGMLLLWKWELLGGALSIAGMIAFYAINFAASGRLPGGPVFPLCFLPGMLILASALIEHRRTNQER